jgi:hypothetical protein
LAEPPFEKCVFTNCPFDRDYDGILQAILFCIVYLGLSPRIATERMNSAEMRLAKLSDLMVASKFSIHDLSRCQAEKGGEYYRLNMPFELGLDYGCRQYFRRGREQRKMLILEEHRHRYQAAISDLAGCDIAAHEGNYEQAVRKIRNWLVSEANIDAPGAARILGAYVDFQEWYYERQLAAGFSDDDIQDYPTKELLEAMRKWVAEGKPT